MNLRAKQSEFARQLPRLLDQAHALGFEVTLGDAYRDPRVFGQVGERKGYGARRSAHKQRLAIDLNLFRDGRYLGDTDAHRQLGEWWESIGGIWGGRFNDGNHYEWPSNPEAGMISGIPTVWPESKSSVSSASAEIRRLQEENQRLRDAVTKRSARMQIMRDWLLGMETWPPETEGNAWEDFLVHYHDAKGWFDEDGVPK